MLERVREVAASLSDDVYIVGGTVRDVLLAHAVHDLDLAIGGDAMAFARALADGLDGHFVELDAVNAIARVVLIESRYGVAHIDCARLQGTLEQDLHRRDFTINALAVPLVGADVIDVCGGLDDLAAGIVRMNGADVFSADPLRLLRAARIAAELEFAIEPSTKAEIQLHARDVRSAAGERRRDELARILDLDDAYPGLLLLDDLNLLDALLPEVTTGRDVTQPPQWHTYDVFEHGLRAVEAMDSMLVLECRLADRSWMHEPVWKTLSWHEQELRVYFAEELSEGRSRAALMKLAALLHDVGKPQTRTVDPDGRIRFFDHAIQGAAVACQIMRRLRFSASEIRFVSTLVHEHLRPVQLAQPGKIPTKRAVYRFCRDLGDALPAVLFVALADAAASGGPGLASGDWSRHIAHMNALLVRSIEVKGIVSRPALLSGHDLMDALELAPGPVIGELLGALQEAEALGDVKDRDAALAFVRSLSRKPEESEVPDRTNT